MNFDQLYMDRLYFELLEFQDADIDRDSMMDPANWDTLNKLLAVLDAAGSVPQESK